MTRYVCIVCDAHKPYAQSVSEPSTCLECGALATNREVAPDSARIAPGSTIRYGEQRQLFERDAPTAHGMSEADWYQRQMVGEPASEPDPEPST